jgi:hypothetical protein
VQVRDTELQFYDHRLTEAQLFRLGRCRMKMARLIWHRRL